MSFGSYVVKVSDYMCIDRVRFRMDALKVYKVSDNMRRFYINKV